MYWRDCDAWRHENLSMNTTSNEAAKLYDCCLTQLVKWREDQLYGGIDGTLAQMINADPSFVMGHVLKCGTELIGNALPSPKSPSTSVETLLSQADIQSPNLSKREMMSVEGALFFTCFFFGMFLMPYIHLLIRCCLIDWLIYWTRFGCFLCLLSHILHFFKALLLCLCCPVSIFKNLRLF